MTSNPSVSALVRRARFHRSVLAAVLGGSLAAAAGVHARDKGGYTASMLATVVPTVAAAPPRAAAALQGKPAPDLRWPDLDGAPHELKQWRGRPVLLNYWASWCGPCIKEMPELDAFARAQPTRGGVRVVGVALDEADAARAFLKRAPVSYPILVERVPEGEGGSSGGFGNARGVLPYTVLLDAQGRVVRTKLGPVTEAELAAWTRSLAP